MVNLTSYITFLKFQCRYPARLHFRLYFIYYLYCGLQDEGQNQKKCRNASKTCSVTAIF